MAASWIKRVWDKSSSEEISGTTVSDSTFVYPSDPWYNTIGISPSTSSGTTNKEALKRLEKELRELTGLNEVEVLRAKLKELQKENEELKEFIEKWAIGETDE